MTGTITLRAAALAAISGEGTLTAEGQTLIYRPLAGGRHGWVYRSPNSARQALANARAAALEGVPARGDMLFTGAGGVKVPS
jgi:hypothetical protein